ncbi:MAG: enoyl-CoA hydratase/isomerase family protein, partial [Geminicoccaceae bacterium]
MSELRVEREGPLAIVTLARAAKLNALTFPMLDGLAAAADAIEADDDCRAVVLTGEGGKAFCAGADIAEWGALGPLEFGRRWIVPGHRVFDRWARLRQPVIAMLNGIAFGGGLELAATADYRLAEAHVRLGLPETQVGIVPGWSGTQRLVRRAGAPAVKRLALTGEPVDAAEALRLGLVDEVVATGDGMARARTLAATMA